MPTTLRAALREHWPEYLIEAWALGTFMVSAGIVATMLGHPSSPIHRAIPSPMWRNVAGRPRHGADRDCAHLLPMGQALRRAYESRRDADFPASRERSAAGTRCSSCWLRSSADTLGVLLWSRCSGMPSPHPPVNYASHADRGSQAAGAWRFVAEAGHLRVAHAGSCLRFRPQNDIAPLHRIRRRLPRGAPTSPSSRRSRA